MTTFSHDSYTISISDSDVLTFSIRTTKSLVCFFQFKLSASDSLSNLTRQPIRREFERSRFFVCGLHRHEGMKLSRFGTSSAGEVTKLFLPRTRAQGLGSSPCRISAPHKPSRCPCVCRCEINAPMSPGIPRLSTPVPSQALAPALGSHAAQKDR